MRFHHNLDTLHKNKYRFSTSLVVTAVIVVLVLVLGFTVVDTQRFFLGLLDSGLRVVMAYFVSLLLATFLALSFSILPKFESLLLPVLDVLQSFPSFALFPLLIAWFGKSSLVTILILIISMIWPILFTLITATKEIKQEFKDVAKIYGATKLKYLTFVVIPLLFPAIITGSIVAWGEAWETIIAAEIIVSVFGVGTYLATAAAKNETSILVVGIMILLLVLFILNKYVWLPLLEKSTKYQQD
jgi:NitT/TauT family transport system permease protein